MHANNLTRTTATLAAAVAVATFGAAGYAQATVIPPGGGGWEVSSTSTSDCIIATVGATAIGGGKVEIGGQIEAYNSLVVKSGTAYIQVTPVAGGTVAMLGPWKAPTSYNWILPNSEVTAKAGTSLRVVLKGLINTPSESCQVGDSGAPSLTIKVQ